MAPPNLRKHHKDCKLDIEPTSQLSFDMDPCTKEIGYCNHLEPKLIWSSLFGNLIHSYFYFVLKMQWANLMFVTLVGVASGIYIFKPIMDDLA
jgi:hypothetical protein